MYKQWTTPLPVETSISLIAVETFIANQLYMALYKLERQANFVQTPLKVGDSFLVISKMIYSKLLNNSTRNAQRSPLQNMKQNPESFFDVKILQSNNNAVWMKKDIALIKYMIFSPTYLFGHVALHSLYKTIFFSTIDTSEE